MSSLRLKHFNAPDLSVGVRQPRPETGSSTRGTKASMDVPNKESIVWRVPEWIQVHYHSLSIPDFRHLEV